MLSWLALSRYRWRTCSSAPAARFAAVVVKDGKIIAEGANEVTAMNDPTAHAEVVAIREACRKLNAFDLHGCEIYTSCEPCPMCLGAIYWARPARVYYANSAADAARAGFDDAFIYQEIARPHPERQHSHDPTRAGWRPRRISRLAGESGQNPLLRRLPVDTRSIGKSVPRKEGREKVTGCARYVDDLVFPGMLHGVTVRSPAPRGRIREIRFAGDIPWNEFTIVTAKDVCGKNCVALLIEDQPCLADGFVNHCEEAVVLLAHHDKYLLEEARRNVHIEIDPLPAIFSLEDSLARKEIIWGTDNIFKSFRVEKGNVDQVWATADFIVEGEYQTGAQEQLYIEPQGVIAQVNDADGVTVWGSLQCPYYVHKALVTLFGLPKDRVRVIQTETGGGFGGKEEYPSMIAAHAALLAQKSGHPVKIIYDRAEDMAATTKRHPSKTRHRTAVTREGKFLAMDIDFTIDGGAYQTLSPVVLSRGTIHAAGPYQCPNVRIHSRAMATNAPPHGAFRGFGAPQSVFALERHLDRVAAAIGVAPDELRRRNFIQQGDTLAVSQVVKDKVDMNGLLDRALALSDYHAKRRRFARRKFPPARRHKKRHRLRLFSTWRRIHRFRRRISGVRSSDGGDARRHRARPRGQHRNGSGHQHNFFADRRRRARPPLRSNQNSATRHRAGAQ